MRGCAKPHPAPTHTSHQPITAWACDSGPLLAPRWLLPGRLPVDRPHNQNACSIGCCYERAACRRPPPAAARRRSILGAPGYMSNTHECARHYCSPTTLRRTRPCAASGGGSGGGCPWMPKTGAAIRVQLLNQSLLRNEASAVRICARSGLSGNPLSSVCRGWDKQCGGYNSHIYIVCVCVCVVMCVYLTLICTASSSEVSKTRPFSPS